MRWLLILWTAASLGGASWSWAQKSPRPELTFCCSPRNDLFLALQAYHFRRYDQPIEAIRNATEGSAVLLLADEYPEHPVRLEAAAWAVASEKRVRLFVEYPAAIPGLDIGPARSTSWERLVIASEKFAPVLPKLRILAAHGCHFVPVSTALPPDLVVARVAGYDTALFGIPTAGAFPVLFEVPERKCIVATTKLSGFVSARFAPVQDWLALWDRILGTLSGGSAPSLEVQPLVQPAYGREAKLPRRYEREAFGQAAHWFAHSRLLVRASEKAALERALAGGAETGAAPGPESPEGDGSLGVLEGYASGISPDGSQLRRLPLRADCQAESAMVLALDARLNRHAHSGAIARNLLDFLYFNSGLCRGLRADPRHPAFGLIGWGDVAPAWRVANYGDDNARVLLATALAAASLHETRWDEPLLRGCLANFRTTGRLGFRGDRIDLPDLEKNGWRFYHQAETVNYAPHFESYLWACYLWAYHQTGYEPLLDRTKTAVALTMRAYPARWRWQNQLERARMLLCLAWLARIENTVEHRRWLDAVAGDLLAWQQPSGAIHERLGKVKGGFFQAPQRNEDYGTTETPLLQRDGDPVTDQLYTTGFALLGLHEAAGATGDPRFQRAEDKLADYLCRIQNCSKALPWLNGCWFRAFDDRRWEAWASSADVGWGAWSVESGWGQAWTAAVLALRRQHRTFWESTSNGSAGGHFEKLKRQLELEN
ncbi:MAG: hypothetical protein ABSH34_06195 [Verrucomicrobiota bacterium]|jgi:hypothetical protein